MTKTIDLLALLRVRMHHGTWDAPGNESAGAFPGIVKHTTPRKHAWVRGTPTPRKGLPRAQINVGAAPRTTKMRHKARGKKCSLGLQVTVEAEAGLFLAAAPQTAVAALPQEAAPGPGRAGSEAFSRSSATGSGPPAARNRTER